MARLTLRERLSARLAEAGWVVAPEAFNAARGGARTCATMDTFRWEAYGSMVDYPGHKVLLASFETMTSCAKAKSVIVFKNTSYYEVGAGG